MVDITVLLQPKMPVVFTVVGAVAVAVKLRQVIASGAGLEALVGLLLKVLIILEFQYMAVVEVLVAALVTALTEQPPVVVEVQPAKEQKAAMAHAANFVFGGLCNESASN